MNRETRSCMAWIRGYAELQVETSGKSAQQIYEHFRALQRQAMAGGDALLIRMLFDVGSLWRVEWDKVEKQLNEGTT